MDIAPELPAAKDHPAVCPSLMATAAAPEPGKEALVDLMSCKNEATNQFPPFRGSEIKRQGPPLGPFGGAALFR